MKIIWLLLTLAWLGGCSAEPYDPYRAVYEGIKMNKDSNKTPQEKELNPTPSYDSYKKQRDKQP